MSYKHGDWCCKPASKEEAQEIIDRAVASGAYLLEDLSDYGWKCRKSWGVKGGNTKTADPKSFIFEKATVYTIDEVRQKFPLPDKQTKWDGEGFPPAGVVCEFKLDEGEWYETYIVGRSRTGGIVFECSKFSPGFLYGECLSEEKDRFRPIRTEREIFVEHVLGLVTPGAQTDAELAEAIYDALKSGDLKAPEVE